MLTEISMVTSLPVSDSLTPSGDKPVRLKASKNIFHLYMLVTISVNNTGGLGKSKTHYFKKKTVL